MKPFRVVLNFKSGPSFESIVTADSKQEAIDRLTQIAKSNGFADAVKKAVVVPA